MNSLWQTNKQHVKRQKWSVSTEILYHWDTLHFQVLFDFCPIFQSFQNKLLALLRSGMFDSSLSGGKQIIVTAKNILLDVNIKDIIYSQPEIVLGDAFVNLLFKESICLKNMIQLIIAHSM